MRVSSIQLFRSELTDPKEIHIEPKVVHFEVCEIQDMKPARKKYRIYKDTNYITDELRDKICCEDARQGITAIFNEDSYIEFYKKYHDFVLDLSLKRISRYKKLPVNTKKVHIHDRFNDTKLEKIPYIDVPNGSMIRIEREHEFRHIICNRERLASHVLDCMMINKKEY